MFVGSVDLGNGTGLNLIIVPLKGSSLEGAWKPSTDLLLLCVMQNGKCCTCRPGDHPSRFQEKLGLPGDDAKRLARWLETNLSD